MDEHVRAALVACIEAGAAARRAGADHVDNPHLNDLSSLSDEAAALAVQQCEAWWDGFEEVDAALSGPAVSRRWETVYF